MNNKPKHQQIRSETLDKNPSTILEKAKRFDYYLIALGVVIICISFIRFRLINVPLERDEGEYAYFGKLILDGIAPFKEAYSMKLPGTYGMYALIMEVFGRNIYGIHLGLLLINAATIVFTGYLLRASVNCVL